MIDVYSEDSHHVTLRDLDTVEEVMLSREEAEQVVAGLVHWLQDTDDATT